MATQRKLTEAGLIIIMQQQVIAHLEKGHTPCETCKIIMERGEQWRKRAEELLDRIEQDEKWLHHERTGEDPEEQELLRESLEVIENNIDEITGYIEQGE